MKVNACHLVHSIGEISLYTFVFVIVVIRFYTVYIVYIMYIFQDQESVSIHFNPSLIPNHQ